MAPWLYVRPALPTLKVSWTEAEAEKLVEEGWRALFELEIHCGPIDPELLIFRVH
jgi:hypothetical protein